MAQARWSPHGYLDSLKLARALWPGLSSYQLQDLLLHAAVAVPPAWGRAHRAAYDAVAAAMLMQHLVVTFDLRWQDVLHMAAMDSVAPNDHGQDALF